MNSEGCMVIGSDWDEHYIEKSTIFAILLTVINNN